jgi:CDP-diacylglycerol--glycerol-3-phosphate 3-phosphatidyltransferase
LITVYQLKPAFQNLLRPLAKTLVSAGITANQVTLAGFGLSCVLGFALWSSPHDHFLLFLVPAFQFFRMGLNAIDGMMAREHNMKTPLGAILNELTDVLADAALYYPFYKILPEVAEFVAPLIILSIVAEMTGVIAVQIGAGRRYDGPFGKSDRAFVFSLIALLVALNVQISPALPTVFILMIMLSIITIINRAHKALQEVKK